MSKPALKLITSVVTSRLESNGYKPTKEDSPTTRRLRLTRNGSSRFTDFIQRFQPNGTVISSTLMQGNHVFGDPTTIESVRWEITFSANTPSYHICEIALTP